MHRSLLLASLLFWVAPFQLAQANANGCEPRLVIVSQGSLESVVQEHRFVVKSYLSDTSSEARAQKALCEYTGQISDILSSLGYRHSPMLLKEEWGTRFKNLAIPVHRILPESQTRLGRLARELDQRVGVDVVYAPLLLSLVGGKGAFIEQRTRPILVLTNDTIFSDSIDDHTNDHEMVHMWFWAYRSGRMAEFYPRAPVHISYETRYAINPKASMGVYQTYMSFEEMVAFASSISKIANSNDSQFEHSLQTRGRLKLEIEKLIVISENALIAIERALSLLHSSGITEIITVPGIEGQYYLISDSNYSVRVFLPTLEVQKCKRDCVEQIRGYLKRAKHLAEFNKSYFTSNQSESSRALKQAKEFEFAQRRFIEAL